MEIIHHHFDHLKSTNDWSKEHLETFDKESLTIVTADTQTGGRGRYGRKWVSPVGENIYASFCFFIDEDQQDPLSLTHLLAISIAKVLENRGIAAQIKWPNDVLVKRKKIAGILCETEYLAPHFGVVIGVGLNVNMDEKTLETVGQPATSLFVETGKNYAVSEILQELSAIFSKDLTLFMDEGFQPFLATFRKLIFPGLQGQQVL